MLASAFIDTNIVVYALVRNDPRSAIAEQLVATGPRINVQVTNEFANVARRKLLWSWDRIEEAVATIYQLCGPPLALTHDTHRNALDIARRYDFHMYDALIVASALDANCTTLYSEDMQSGQKIRGLMIRNPFLGQ